jgi:hypothetical protein
MSPPGKALSLIPPLLFSNVGKSCGSPRIRSMEGHLNLTYIGWNFAVAKSAPSVSDSTVGLTHITLLFWSIHCRYLIPQSGLRPWRKH